MVVVQDETPEDPTLRPPPDHEAKSTPPQPPGKGIKKELGTSAHGSTGGAGSVSSSSSSSSSRGGKKEKRRAVSFVEEIECQSGWFGRLCCCAVAVLFLTTGLLAHVLA